MCKTEECVLSPLVTVVSSHKIPSAEKVAVVVNALGSAGTVTVARSGFLAPDASWRRAGRRRWSGRRLSRLSGVIDLSWLGLNRTSHYGSLAISGPPVQIGFAAQHGNAVHSRAAGDWRIHGFGFADGHDRALQQGRQRHRRGGRLSHRSEQGAAAQLGFLRILLQGVFHLPYLRGYHLGMDRKRAITESASGLGQDATSKVRGMHPKSE